MVKINLLPVHILERSRVRRTAVMVGLLLVLQGVALLLAVMHAKAKVAMEQDRATYWSQVASAVDDAAAMTSERQSAAGPYHQWVSWVDSEKTYETGVADLLQYLARFVHAKVALRQFEWSGAQVRLTGVTDSVETAKQFYLNMLRCPIVASVQLQTQVPGWSPPQLGVAGRTGAASTGTAPGASYPSPGLSSAVSGAGPAATGYVYGQSVNPKERVPVALQIQLLPQYVPAPSSPPTAPTQATGTAAGTTPGVSSGAGAAGPYGLRGPPAEENEPGVTPR
jgi:Tfp pilus assembly protein PilN